MELLSNISEDWMHIIYDEEAKTMLNNIYKQLEDELETTTPCVEDCFNWCRFTPLNGIKVIILGQDPYHKDGWAHGLSFSCLSTIPPSLKNIYKSLLNAKLIDNIPTHGELTSWATQNVLLLNASLTTTIGKAGDHMGMWLPYTQLVVQRLCQYYYDNGEQLIFMLWGNFAKKFSYFIDEDFHIVLNWIHPSPLAQRVKDKSLLFINCTHFKECNELLINDNKLPINWNSINTTKITTKKQKNKRNVKKKEKTQHNSHCDNKNRDAKSILNINDRHHIAFTDGGCHPNNKSKKSRAGWALSFVSGPLKDRVVYGNLDVKKHNASNIRAEGYAIIRALDYVNDCKQEWDKLTIVTDCEFWVNMVEIYMPKWNKNTFIEKSNPDLTQRLWNIYNDISNTKNIQFIHIKSHDKDGWSSYDDGTFEKFCYIQNDYVDKMCNYSRTKLQPGDEVFTNVEYE